MAIPARTLRSQVESLEPAQRDLSWRDHAERSRIRTLACALFARHGRHAITLSAFALAIGRTAAKIRRHFADLDALLIDIVHHHLRDIAARLAEIPADATDRPAALRAAYLAATRTGYGARRDAHELLLRDFPLLPEEDRAPIELFRATIGEILAGSQAAHALALLDNLAFTAQEIETLLAALNKPQSADEPTASPEKQLPPLPVPYRPLTLAQVEVGRAARANRCRAGPEGRRSFLKKRTKRLFS